MAKSAKKYVIMAAIETTYGTAVALNAGTDAILCGNLSITPLQANEVERPYMDGATGAKPTILVGAHVTCSFDVEVAGSGTPGNAPAYGRLLRGSGYSETINAGTSVVYEPVDESFDSLTIWVNWDGNKHPITGGRGNVSYDVSPGGVPVMKFTFTGLFNAPVAEALPSPTLSAFRQPVPVNDANTSFTLYGHELGMSSLTIDTGMNPSFEDRPGAATVEITDHAVTGSVTLDAASVSTVDWTAHALANDTGILALQHGIVAGNIVKLDGPAVEVRSPTYASGGQDRLENQLALRLTKNPSGDDLVVTVQ